MPRRCVVIGCLTKGLKHNKSFYRFPSDQELCKKWLKALCNLQLVKMYETAGHLHLNKNKFVCSDHFEDKFLRNINAPSQGLFDGAVPTVNINLNMDALISSLKQSEILNEITKPKTPIKKGGKTPTKRLKEKVMQSADTMKDKCKSEEVDKEVKITPPTNTVVKSKISSDDIPLKELFGGKIKTEPNVDTNKDIREVSKDKVAPEKQNKIKTIKKHKRKKVRIEKQFKRKKKDKKKKIRPKNIEQVFLPIKRICDNSSDLKSPSRQTYESNIRISDGNLIVHVKKEKSIDDVIDPLGNLTSEPINKKLKNVKKKKKKLKKAIRRKIIKKKKAFKTSVKKLIKIVVAPKTMDNNDLKITTQGPKKIIKLVVPPKATAGNENNQGPNKIIKVVVPKKTANGKEINLERDEINKILRLVSAPKAVGGKGIKLITQSAEVNRILKLASVPNGTQMKNIENKNLNKLDVAFTNNVDGKVIKLVNKECGKILRKVLPPKNINSRAIKIITTSSKDSNVLRALSPFKESDGKKTQVVEPSLENCKRSDLCSSSANSKPDVTNNSDNLGVDDAVIKDNVTTDMIVENGLDVTGDSPDNRSNSPFESPDSPFGGLQDNNADNVQKSDQITVDKDLPCNNEEFKTITKDSPPIKVPVEVNPMTEELCKRIKYMIDQRFAENNDSSDSDSGEMNIPLIHITKPPQKSLKQIVDSYRGETKCSCDTIYQEKMKNLYQEEKDLKRQLKNVQKYVFHYKDNIRKRTSLISDLRKQIPVKKAAKTGQLIKTVIPLDKIKEKNPGTYRFTKSLKTFALDLFYSSPLSYNILEKMYFLPSRKTLKNWLTNPKNTSTDLLDNIPGNAQQSLESMEENVDILNESVGTFDRHPEPIHHMQHNHHHSHHLESLDVNMSAIEDNIEPLQENMDEIMFRNDLAAAIMNT